MSRFINQQEKINLNKDDNEPSCDQERQAGYTSKRAFQVMIEKSIASAQTDLSLDQIFEEARIRAQKQ